MKLIRAISTALIVLLAFAGVYFVIQKQGFPDAYVIRDMTQLIVSNEKKNYSGAISVNLDDDQGNEIFVSALSSTNVFFEWSMGKFKALSIPELEEKEGKTFSVSACDLTGDGRDEILLINREAPSSRLVTYSKGKWNDIPMDLSVREKLSLAYAAACIDRKGDHHYGLAVTLENGFPLYLEKNDESIVDIAGAIGLSKTSKGRSIVGVPGPTGRTNIFFGNSEGANFFYVNKGDGTFEEKAESLGISDPGFEARGADLIDLNHDELIDLIYGNHFGPLRIMQQSPDGRFVDVTPENFARSYAVNSAVVFDFNLDGYEDIYLNNIRHENELMARHEDSWFPVDLGDFSEKDFYGISSLAGDLNRDGKMDLLNTHGDGQIFPLTLYSFDPAGEMVRFKVLLKNGGLPRGAQLKLRSTLRDRIKVIHSGSGRFANYDDELTFGLLKGEKVISAEVILTSGQKVIKNEGILVRELNTITVDGQP